MGIKERPDPDRIQCLRQEFVNELPDDRAVRSGYLVENTSADDEDEAKLVLRRMLDEGLVKTTPDWKYKLAAGSSN